MSASEMADKGGSAAVHVTASADRDSKQAHTGLAEVLQNDGVVGVDGMKSTSSDQRHMERMGKTQEFEVRFGL